MNTNPLPCGRSRSIKFPMRKERTGNRRGPRFVMRPDKTGLSGAALCAAGMVSLAMDALDEVRGTGAWTHARPWSNERLYALNKRIAKWRVRYNALMARLFVGTIDKEDPRFTAIHAEHAVHMRELEDLRTSS